jgi:glyoxylase-like metal-dependent hydrolase (beta-lactamase superfamily II)
MAITTHEFRFGDFRCWVISDTSRAHAAGELVVNAQQAQLERVALELNLELDRIHVDYSVLLVNTADQNVLVDAGFGGPDTQLRPGLESLGIDPGDIGTIVITHSDWDHIGGILDDPEHRAFPRARYVMLQRAWQHWASADSRSRLASINAWPEEKTELVWETYSRIQELLILVDAEEEFLPGLRLIPASGHRCDHSVLKVSSSREQLLHISDAVVHPLLMAHERWYSTYDSDPAQAVATKKRLLDWCASERALVFGAHFPFPGIGRVQRHDGGWSWHPERPTRGQR